MKWSEVKWVGFNVPLNTLTNEDRQYISECFFGTGNTAQNSPVVTNQMLTTRGERGRTLINCVKVWDQLNQSDLKVAVVGICQHRNWYTSNTMYKTIHTGVRFLWWDIVSLSILAAILQHGWQWLSSSGRLHASSLCALTSNAWSGRSSTCLHTSYMQQTTHSQVQNSQQQPLVCASVVHYWCLLTCTLEIFLNTSFLLVYEIEQDKKWSKACRLYSSLYMTVMTLSSKAFGYGTCYWEMTQFYYPPVEWVTTAFASQLLSIITLWPVLISQPNEGRKLSWLGWLFTHQDGIPVATNDHPLTTNCAKCRVILLMCAMPSSLGQIAI